MLVSYVSNGGLLSERVKKKKAVLAVCELRMLNEYLPLNSEGVWKIELGIPSNSISQTK